MSERIAAEFEKPDTMSKLKSKSKEKALDVVKNIADKQSDSGYNRAFSFVSKYLSFVCEDCVPIYDYYAQRVMGYLAKEKRLSHKTKLNDYDNYFHSINELINSDNEYEKLNYKKLDAFLWIMGKIFETGSLEEK